MTTYAENTLNNTDEKEGLTVNPVMFGLWIFIGTVIMLFAALTSAYIVRKAEGNWILFTLPSMLYYSTAVVVASSASLAWVQLSIKKDQFNTAKLGLLITGILGILFIVTQLYSFQQMIEGGVYLVGNPSGSFLYLLVGLHGLHLISGIIYLLVVLRAAFTNKIHAKNQNPITMFATYWHFLGALWIYLFVFLLLNQ